MSFTYTLRLLCICLAAFFLVHLAAGLVVSFLAPVLVRVSERIRARRGAWLLLALRLFPAGFATLVVAGVCVPSYLMLEANANTEHVGLLCVTAAALGAAIWAVSLARALRAIFRSSRYIAYCRRIGRSAPLGREGVCILDEAAPLIALTGIVHPHLVISKPVIDTLSDDQLSAAVRHERAHQMSRDNLKRLLVLLAPGLLPGFRGFELLEHGWGRITEWAADDLAVAGSSARSLSLAAALVRLARMGGAARPTILATSLLSDTCDLSARVDRLLGPVTPPASERRLPVAIPSAVSLAAGLAVMLQPATLDAAHRLLEILVR